MIRVCFPQLRISVVQDGGARVEARDNFRCCFLLLSTICDLAATSSLPPRGAVTIPLHTKQPRRFIPCIQINIKTRDTDFNLLTLLFTSLPSLCDQRSLLCSSIVLTERKNVFRLYFRHLTIRKRPLSPRLPQGTFTLNSLNNPRPNFNFLCLFFLHSQWVCCSVVYR